MKFKSFALCLLASPFFGGCHDFNEARQEEKNISDVMKKHRVPLSQSVVVSNTPYLVGPSLKPSAIIPGPLKPHIELIIAKPLPIREVAILAENATHIHVNLDDDLDDTAPSYSENYIPASDGKSVGGLPAPPDLKKPLPMSRIPPSIPKWHGVGPWIRYSGNKAGLFQTIASHYGCWEKFEDGAVTFYRTETKTFPIPAFSEKTEQNSAIVAITGGGGSNSGGGMGGMSGGMGSMGGGGMGGMGGMGGGSGSNSGNAEGVMSSTRESSTNPYDDLEKTAKAIANGGQIVLDKNLGTLTVTGTPGQVIRVERWIKALQSSMMTSVSVDVHVYTLQVTRESAMSFSPKIAVESMGKAWGSSVMPAAAPAIQSQHLPFSAGASIISDNGALGQFKGSQIAVAALSEFGNVTEVYERQAVTTNGQAADFQNGLNTTYLQSSQSYLATNAGSSASLEPGVVMSGFSGSVTPKLIGNKILLRMSFLIQTLQKLNEIESNGSKMQLPITNSTTMDNQIVLKNNQVLVIQGYVDDSKSRNRSGAGWADFWGLGGGGEAQKKKTLVYVIVNAHTLNEAVTEESNGDTNIN